MTSDEGNQISPSLPADAVAPSMEPAPIPLAALAYSMPMQGRPSILTSVAITSIVIASISALSCLMCGCYSTAFFVASRTARAAAATTVPPTAVSPGVTSISITPSIPGGSGATSGASVGAPAGPAPLAVGPDGLDAQDRAVAIEALGKIQPMPEARRRQLEAFLAENGQEAFPTGGRRLTAEQVRASISRSSSFVPGDEAAAVTTFVSGWGTLSIYTDRAQFNRTDSDRPLVSSAIPEETASFRRTSNPYGYVPLTVSEVQQVQWAVQSLAASRLNAAQSATLVQQLQSPRQKFVQVRNLQSPVADATAMPDGSILIQFNSGSSLQIDASGRVTSSTAFGTSVTSAGVFNVSGTTATVVILESIFSLGLAVLLLVGAILMLRQSEWGRRLHWIFVWLKIPAAIVGWLAIAQLFGEVFAGASAGTMPGTGGPTTGGAIAAGSALAAIACIYPIVLIFVLRTRGVREYYSTVRS